MRRTVLVIALAAACSSAHLPAPAAPAAPVIAEPAAVPEPDCVAECRTNHGEPADGEPILGYCDEICTPITEPNADCVAGCEKSHEPGAYYDDDGEYQQDEDTRTDEQRAADREACAGECATVPTLSSEAIAACRDECTAAGTDEMRCSVDCDPDPYDECRYLPCD